LVFRNSYLVQTDSPGGLKAVGAVLAIALLVPFITCKVPNFPSGSVSVLRK
jgi:hypothetical protein